MRLDHGANLQVRGRTARLLAGIAVVLALATVAGGFALRARHAPSDRLSATGLTPELYDARVVSVDESRACPVLGEDAEPGEALDIAPTTCPAATLRLLGGPDEGETVTIDLPSGAQRPAVDPGDKVVVAHTEGAGAGFEYNFADRQRKPVLFWLGAVFAIVVVVLGRLRGLAALVGLAGSLVVIVGFVLPAILDGQSPLPVALVGASAIAFLALYLAHGFRASTTVALLGTLASLGLTALIAVVVTKLAGLTGFASEEATIVQIADARIDLTGLVLAGIVIGALGAIDDMTVTQVAAVGELHEANPELGRRRLYGGALRIGQSHVASTVNTLALAYAGASVPVLLLFVLSRQSLGTVANGEVMATEIVRTLAGSIGLVASVPITTWLAVRAIPLPPDA